MDLEELTAKLAQTLPPNRFRHTLGVVEWSEKLAEQYLMPVIQARQAALLHDCAKYLSDEQLLKLAEQAGLPIEPETRLQPFLLHGPVGAYLAQRDYGVTDPVILDAVSRHTLGADQMTGLDKVIFLADMVEPNRSYPGVRELRALTLLDLDKAMVAALDQTIRHLLDRGDLLHSQTVRTRNALLQNRPVIPGRS